MRRHRFASTALLAAVLFGSATGTRAEVPAVWKSHELTLGYQGLTTSYSCQGLREKMKSLLRYFGAREETLKVSAYGCAGGPYRPVPAVNLKLEFQTLDPLPEGAETAAGEVVRAQWVERDLFPQKRVQRDTPRNITRGDCEVVEKFTAKVLPSFTHETLQDLTTCIPNRLDGTIPNLRVRVLAPEEATGTSPS